MTIAAASVVIREAHYGDINAIVAVPPCATTMLTDEPVIRAGLVRGLIDSPSAAMLLAEQDGRVVGFFAVYAYHHPISGQLFATDIGWWVDPEAHVTPQLIRAAEDWATARGVEVLQFAAANVRAERLYAARGYTAAARHYEKRVGD